MKRKLFSIFTLVFALAFVPFGVKAAEVEVASEADLITCVSDDNTCKLTGNIILENLLDIRKNVTIDLNGHNITAHDDLSFAGNMITILHGAKLTINDSVGTGIISSGNDGSLYGAISLTKKVENDITKVAALEINAGTIEGYYYGISGNGNPDRINTEIVVNGGVVKGLCADDSVAIFHPQVGKVIINGGELIAATGIEMRSGTLIVNGGTITATGVPLNVEENQNGTTTFGAGIAVAQHTTLKEVDVTINGGTIKGYSAFYESNPQGNENVKDDVTIEINGGTFEAINGGTLVVYSSDFTNFIKKGTFNIDVEDKYVAATSVEKELNEQVTIGPEYGVKTEENTDGTVAVDKLNAMPGEVVKLDVTPKANFKVSKIVVINLKTNEEVEVVDGSFVMPDAEVSINVTFVEDIPNPNTSDNVLIYFVALIISGVSFASCLYVFKKNN